MTDYRSAPVSWHEFHAWALPILTAAGSRPIAGSPLWFDLPDDDPRKIAAVIDAAQHWILRIDTLQDAAAQASRDISDSADWTAAAHELLQLAGARKARVRIERITDVA